MSERVQLAVLGAGAWGTALAISLARAGRSLRLHARSPARRQALRRGDPGPALAGARLPAGISVADSVAEAVSGAEVVLLAVPAAATASMVQTLRPALDRSAGVVLLAKGFERGTGRRLSAVAAEQLRAPERVLVLLGPSHAEEVAADLPTAIVLAGGDAERRRAVQHALSHARLRVYTNEDLRGVEIAAALKNVLAIATGICDGLGLGDNTKGALVTRGLAEISRLGVALGGRLETFYGLSGVGDVVTTCLSRHSRNRALGERVGRGEAVVEAVRAIGQVVEGVETTRTVLRLAEREGVSVPISTEVGRVLFEGADPRDAMERLMLRGLKDEFEPTPCAPAAPAEEEA